MNDNDLIVLKQAISGDKQALIKLIKQNENNIYTTLFYLKRNVADINDLVQIVLIKLSNKITQLKNPMYFKTWLNQIIVNTYYDYLRKTKYKNCSFDSINTAKSISNPLDDPQNNILYTELDELIKQTISKLPSHYKIPITLREIQGLSYEDISTITKTSVGTVKSRISRARTIIKNRIKRYERS